MIPAQHATLWCPKDFAVTFRCFLLFSYEAWPTSGENYSDSCGHVFKNICLLAKIFFHLYFLHANCLKESRIAL